MNIKEIKEMIDLMNKNNLNEIEVEKDGTKIRLKKTPGGISEHLISEEKIMTPQRLAPDQKPQAVEQKTKKTVEIKAPMVGTFYSSPSPEAPPFVDIGNTIEKGQVVCIIEAMKLMNEIKSEVRGKIVDVLVENGNPIEFGQVLFLIEPAQ
ncbi:MAG: acetyl-CoA carboxylase biotin carboxyl carrier protein [Candidatus Omnitrophica bacterium]|nr:acetyl-CoA carboxylase biotin carboxyl carrier protein [Candidatus Omnitrophota bacterium]